MTFTVTTNAEDGQPVTLAFNDAATPSRRDDAERDGRERQRDVRRSAVARRHLPGDRDLQEHERHHGHLAGRPASRSTRPRPNLTVTSADGRPVLRSDRARQPGPVQRLRAGRRRPTRPACPRRWAPGSTTCASRSAAPPAASARPPSRRSTRDACVPVTCPGGAPFDITVTLKDAAGNPTDDDHPGRLLRVDACRRCRSSRPVSDAPAFNDPSKHILSATAPVGVRDQDRHAGRADRRRRLHRSQRQRDAARSASAAGR